MASVLGKLVATCGWGEKAYLKRILSVLNKTGCLLLNVLFVGAGNGWFFNSML